MRDPQSDQAAGLRRMFRSDGPRPVLVSGVSGERGPVALVLACALAALGEHVLLIHSGTSVPLLAAERVRLGRFDAVLRGERSIAEAAVALDPRTFVIEAGDALDDLVGRGSEGERWLAASAASLTGGRRAVVPVIAADPGRFAVLADWLAVRARTVLATGTSSDAVTQTYAQAKILAATGATSELELVAVARGGGLAADAVLTRLCGTAARYLALEVSRLAIVDGRDIDALAHCAGGRDLTYAAALRARLGRALADRLAVRWPVLPANTPAAARAGAPLFA